MFQIARLVLVCWAYQLPGFGEQLGISYFGWLIECNGLVGTFRGAYWCQPFSYVPWMFHDCIWDCIVIVNVER